jgi:hypothetical protein
MGSSRNLLVAGQRPAPGAAAARHRDDIAASFPFGKYAEAAARVFKEYGAQRVVGCWGDEVPEGKLTSFPMAVAGVLFVLYALVQYPGWSNWQLGGATVLAMGAGVLAAVALEAVILFVRHVLPSLLLVAVVGALLAHFIGGVDVIAQIARLLPINPASNYVMSG